MLFRKKKKEEVHKGDIFLAKGIYLEKPMMDNGNIIFNCFLRSLIVFLLVLGSIGGFLSAIELSYNYLLVITVFLILSMYFSFLYALPKFVYRDIGYIVFFGIFIVAIYVLRVYANSGFYVCVNTVLNRAQTFFNLSGVREYESQISNDYLTVAIVAIFIGMVIIIILNIWIYSMMSLFWTVLLTFPLLFIPLYMKLTPDPFYMIALGIGYMAVVIFKANGHYLAFAWDAAFKVKKGKENRVTYTQDAGVFKQILATLTLLGFCMIVIIESFLSPIVFESRFKNDRLREATADSIGNFVLLGFAGLFNRYASTGGMSGGRLGGVSSVRPDYLPDLIVSYTPYSNEAVYLKAYTGGLYGENQWLSLYENQDVPSETNDTDIFEEESLKAECESLRVNWNEYSASARMDIKNVGADTSYLYYPYYTLFDDYSIYNNHNLLSSTQGIGVQQEAVYYYYPKIVWEDYLGEKIPGEIDSSRINPVFLDVPEKNRTVIEQECRQMGLMPSMTENEIVDTVKQYFQDNIPYTLKPGSTPRNEDFINYFLTRNRKGYCAHFASAATLIFREMGIPARYVEGYAFSLETVLASEINEEKVGSSYYNGYSGLGDSPVMDVEVTDAMAHAWVEIYIDGFGWRVVEVTPGSNETTDENDFWSAFSAFLSNDSGEAGDTGIEWGDLNLSQYKWLIYVILVVIACILIFTIGKIGVRKVIRYRRCNQKNLTQAVIASYADICDMVRVCDRDFNLCRSHMEQLEFIINNYGFALEKETVCQWLEQISFSRKNVSNEEIKTLRDLLHEMRKAIWRTVSLRKKLALCKR